MIVMAEPEYGQMKEGQGPSINYAAKLFVCEELRRRGVAVSPGPRNDGRIELKDRPSLTIRVKARTDAARKGDWVWMAKEKGTLFTDISAKDYTVLVHLDNDRRAVEYFAVPTVDLNEQLIRAQQDWIRQAGVKGRPHNANNRMHRFGYNEDQRQWLREHHQDWSLIVG